VPPSTHDCRYTDGSFLFHSTLMTVRTMTTKTTKTTTTRPLMTKAVRKKRTDLLTKEMPASLPPPPRHLRPRLAFARRTYQISRRVTNCVSIGHGSLPHAKWSNSTCAICSRTDTMAFSARFLVSRGSVRAPHRVPHLRQRARANVVKCLRMGKGGTGQV
jgi:hypothetical protein